jgi:p-aminobenzoyl-glutamate transporter AbgT
VSKVRRLGWLWNISDTLHLFNYTYLGGMAAIKKAAHLKRLRALRAQRAMITVFALNGSP